MLRQCMRRCIHHDVLIFSLAKNLHLDVIFLCLLHDFSGDEQLFQLLSEVRQGCLTPSQQIRYALEAPENEK